MRNYKKIGLRELAESYSFMGFPLTNVSLEESLSPEEAIVIGLLKRNPRIIEGIPVLLIKNNIDYDKLRILIDKEMIWNEFGYLGEFTLTHTKDHNLRNLVDYCRSRMKKSATLYPHHQEFFREFQEENESRWNLIGSPSHEMLKKQLERYL